MIRNAHWLTLIAAAALLIAACRPTSAAVTVDGTESTSRTDEVSFSGKAGVNGAGGTALTVGADEFAFQPDTWRAAASQDVTVTINNRGAIEHNWVILTMGTDISKAAEFSTDMALFDFGSIAAGGSATRTFNVPAGTYQVICDIPGHLDGGMHGMLIVEP
jgi:uncharacterized cupredoxin-like copper-binding protein